ncbi:MAG: acetyltransferase [Cyclobacteriaceae bacterium]|nr:acetyltransferase [Cyclobacteriaceae bacterium]MCH8515116.1 acetyltransferase [Cyclobacteriaceae bacterium]
MLIIVGAGGFAVECLDILLLNGYSNKIYFYDDFSKNIDNHLYNIYPIIKSETELDELIKKKKISHFTIGLGGTKNRKKLFNLFINKNLTPYTIISKLNFLGHFNLNMAAGSVIVHGANISSNITLGKGLLINGNSTIGHDVVIGDYCEISPGAAILGNCQIGELSSIGSNATILPGIKIGKNCVIGAGAVVTKDVPDNSLAIGIPAKISCR